MAVTFPRDFFKAARVALRLSNLELAELAQVSPATLSTVEKTNKHVATRTIEKIRKALESQGVVFLNPEAGHGPGFRINQPAVDNPLDAPDCDTS